MQNLPLLLHGALWFGSCENNGRGQSCECRIGTSGLDHVRVRGYTASCFLSGTRRLTHPALFSHQYQSSARVCVRFRDQTWCAWRNRRQPLVDACDKWVYMCGWCWETRHPKTELTLPTYREQCARVSISACRSVIRFAAGVEREVRSARKLAASRVVSTGEVRGRSWNVSRTSFQRSRRCRQPKVDCK